MASAKITCVALVEITLVMEAGLLVAASTATVLTARITRRTIGHTPALPNDELNRKSRRATSRLEAAHLATTSSQNSRSVQVSHPVEFTRGHSRPRSTTNECVLRRESVASSGIAASKLQCAAARQSIWDRRRKLHAQVKGPSDNQRNLHDNGGLQRRSDSYAGHFRVPNM